MANLDEGGRDKEQEGRCDPGQGVCAEEVAQDQWSVYLDRFSRNHAQAPVNVEVRGESAGGGHRLAEKTPLLGLVAGADHDPRNVELILGSPNRGPQAHIIRGVDHVWRQQDDQGREMLQFVARDGSTTVLTLTA